MTGREIRGEREVRGVRKGGEGEGVLRGCVRSSHNLALALPVRSCLPPKGKGPMAPTPSSPPSTS